MRLLANIFEAMKSLISIGCLCLLTLLPKGIDASEVDRNYLHRLVAEVAVVDREYVAKNEYGYSINDVVLALRNLDEDRIGGHSWVLIRLRDEPTIKKYVSRFVDSEGTDGRAGGVLANSYSPWVIPMVIDSLDAQEIEYLRHPNPEVIGFWGFSGRTATTIREILRRSEEFPDETRAWAEQLPNYGEEPLRELRDTLTVWWEDNEIHFENEEYHLVRPVVWDLQEDAARDEEPERDLESTLEPGEHDLGLEEEKSEESFPPQSSDEEPEMEKSGRSPWPWVFGAVVLVLLPLGVLRMRSKGSGS